MNKKRPIHLDLRLIKLPLPGFVSILHRVSGLLLFLALPLFLRMLQCSLFSIETYTQLAVTLRHPLSKLILISLLWAFLHHFCAGIRYLAIDMDVGVDLAQARASSKWVLFVSIGLTLLIGAWLW
ncbi:MAG: succinate dehydrogenase subunit C [Candidatus Nitrotoga sp. MKT]|nr:MAG: succinate dehydrogenase subunit C [Candidatus Nitrotoga sp. MKT]